jgi:hypothetical protein
MSAHEARTRSSILPAGASESIEVCWSFSRPSFDDRAALRCDVPLRVASRCTVSRRAETHPVTETVQQVPSGCLPGADSATGSAFLPDFDHLAKCGGGQSTVPGRRSASGPDIALLREAVGSGDSVCDTAPGITRPLGQSPRERFHHGTERVKSHFLRQRPCRRVRAALRASNAWIHAIPREHSKSAPLRKRSSERNTRLDWHGTSGEGLLATAGPFTRFPRRRGAVVHGFPGWQYEPGRSPVPGQQPWSSIPIMHALGIGLFLCAGTRRSERFPGTRPLGRMPRGGRISCHAEACRDPHLPFGKGLEECRTRRMPHSGSAVTVASRHFGSGFPFEPTLGPARRVRGVPQRRGILDSRSRRPNNSPRAAFSSVPRHFRAGILFELGF